MFEQLSKIEEKYRKLEEQLALPDVLADQEKYGKLAKELSGVSQVVGLWRQYKKIEEEISGLEHMLNGNHDKAFVELAREEIPRLKANSDRLSKQLGDLLNKDTEDLSKNFIIEIRAGTGGQEASLFVADLYRMYRKFADKYGLTVENISSHTTELGGFKEVIFSVVGKEAYAKFRFESGVHRVQRVPLTEASGRIHTSAVTVAVILEPEENELKIDPKDLKIDVFRASGHGGQSVNTSDSAVRITHLPSGIVVTCQDERSQLKNKNKGMRVLRARLLDKIQHEQKSQISLERRTQIGSGDRSEKIRTYNFPERRVTDHRVNVTVYQLESFLDGNMDEIISALSEAAKKQARENAEQQDETLNPKF